LFCDPFREFKEVWQPCFCARDTSPTEENYSASIPGNEKVVWNGWAVFNKPQASLSKKDGNQEPKRIESKPVNFDKKLEYKMMFGALATGNRVLD
jgi:hypothetical protein